MSTTNIQVFVPTYIRTYVGILLKCIHVTYVRAYTYTNIQSRTDSRNGMAIEFSHWYFCTHALVVKVSILKTNGPSRKVHTICIDGFENELLQTIDVQSPFVMTSPTPTLKSPHSCTKYLHLCNSHAYQIPGMYISLIVTYTQNPHSYTKYIHLIVIHMFTIPVT